MAGSMEARTRAVIFDSHRNMPNLNLANGAGKWSVLPKMKAAHAFEHHRPTGRIMTKIPGILQAHTRGPPMAITGAEKISMKIGICTWLFSPSISRILSIYFNMKKHSDLERVLKYGRKLVAPTLLSLATLAPTLGFSKTGNKQYQEPKNKIVQNIPLEQQPYYEGSLEDFTWPENLETNYNVQTKTNNSLAKATEDYPLSQFMNPFSQPRNTLDYYGSGDVNNDGQISNNDYVAMQNGAQNDRADVDGDGIASTNADKNLLQDYLNENIQYLPAHWNQLQTRQERDSWVSKMMAIDTTDRHDYINPEPGSTPDWREREFVSGNFATQLSLNNWGWEPYSLHPETGQPMLEDTLWSKYDSTNIARFNLPVYWTWPRGPPENITFSHGMNAILTGDNPLNFNDWNFVEPQTDSTNCSTMHWNMPPNSKVTIFGPYCFGNSQEPYYNLAMIRGPPIVNFFIDSIGNTDLMPLGTYLPDGYDHNLILTNPNVGIEPEPQISETYELGNYPNPFNSRTTIKYTLPANIISKTITMNIYNLFGQLVEAYQPVHQSSGKQSFTLDASEYSSGIYFYQLQINGKQITRKMTLIK